MSSSTTSALRVELYQLEPVTDVPGVEWLSIRVEWMRYCPNCDGEHCFVANRRFAGGLIGRCSNCGDERIAPYTRTTPTEEWESLT